MGVKEQGGTAGLNGGGLIFIPRRGEAVLTIIGTSDFVQNGNLLMSVLLRATAALLRH